MPNEKFNEIKKQVEREHQEAKKLQQPETTEQSQTGAVAAMAEQFGGRGSYNPQTHLGANAAKRRLSEAGSNVSNSRNTAQVKEPGAPVISDPEAQRGSWTNFIIDEGSIYAASQAAQIRKYLEGLDIEDLQTYQERMKTYGNREVVMKEIVKEMREFNDNSATNGNKPSQ